MLNLWILTPFFKIPTYGSMDSRISRPLVSRNNPPSDIYANVLVVSQDMAWVYPHQLIFRHNYTKTKSLAVLVAVARGPVDRSWGRHFTNIVELSR